MPIERGNGGEAARPESLRPECRAVSDYLNRLADSQGSFKLDLNQIAEHAGGCSWCYSRLSSFFRTASIPESSYLKETLDELAWSLLNLGRAMVRDRAKSEDDAAAGVQITTDGGGSAEDNVELGSEMIDDVADFAGSSVIGATNLEELRDLLEHAEEGQKLRIDLAIDIFRQVTSLDCRYHAQAWNWIGALLYKNGDFVEAQTAFLSALGCRENFTEVRSFAHCTLAYIYKQQGDFDRAVKSAVRSSALAEEDGKDPFFGRLVEIYVRLLRKGDQDEDRAREAFEAICKEDGGRDRLITALKAPHNEPIAKAVKGSALQSLL